MYKRIYFFITLLVLGVIFSVSCKKAEESVETNSVVVRLPSEPESLHPIFTKSSYGIQIAGHILLPAAEIDPKTLKLSPLLIREIPAEQKVTEGKHAGGTMYQIQFRPEAVWDNGSPVTGNDYLFTIKSVYNPYITPSPLKGFFDYLSEISIDAQDPKNVTVYIDSSFLFGLESVTNFNIYPAHVYDPENIMAKFSLEDLRDPNKKWTAEQDTLLKQFAASFESSKYFRDVVEGAGPYKWDTWTTGEFIRIKRKENWWGDKIKDPPLLLQAYPDEITYRIITDAATAEAALKAGEIDVFAEVPSSSFLKMKEDPEWADKFHYATPALLQVFYLELNNRDPVLSDKRIRQALAYSLDYDGIMNNLLVGLGERTIGPIPPMRTYFHKGLQPLKQDVNKSIELIKEAGWSDSNNNGIPDKVINGKREELTVVFKAPNKGEGMALSSIVKENAKKAGFDVQVEVLDPSQFTQDMRQMNFDIAPMRVRPMVTNDDLYSSLHSTGASNRSGFKNTQADSIIEMIRTSENQMERDSGYYDLQEILYAEQPAIYLYVPLERIIVSKKYELISSSRKPGYFENLFRIAG